MSYCLIWPLQRFNLTHKKYNHFGQLFCPLEVKQMPRQNKTLRFHKYAMSLQSKYK